MFTPPKCPACKTVMTLAINCVLYLTSEGRKLETTLEEDEDSVRIFCKNCGDYLPETKVKELVPFPDGILNQDS